MDIQAIEKVDQAIKKAEEDITEVATNIVKLENDHGNIHSQN